MYVRCLAQLLPNTATVLVTCFESEDATKTHKPVFDCSLEDLVYNHEMMEYLPAFGAGAVNVPAGLAFCPCKQLRFDRGRDRTKVRLKAAAVGPEIGSELWIPPSILVKHPPLLVHPREELMDRLVELLLETGETEEERAAAATEYVDRLFSAIPFALADRLQAGE